MHVSRCLIYKVHAALRPSSIRPPLQQRTHLLYHTLRRLSSTFFSFFDFLLKTGSNRFVFGVLSRALRYNNRRNPFCQHLFSSFFGFSIHSVKSGSMTQNTRQPVNNGPVFCRSVRARPMIARAQYKVSVVSFFSVHACAAPRPARPRRVHRHTPPMAIAAHSRASKRSMTPNTEMDITAR